MSRGLLGLLGLFTVLNWCIGNGEFTEVVTDHWSLAVDEVVTKTLVNTDLGTNHFWDDELVTAVGLDNTWTTVLIELCLCVTETLQEVLVDRPALEFTTTTCMEHLDELLLGNINELISFNTTIVVDTEWLLRNGFGLDRGEMGGDWRYDEVNGWG